MVKSSNWSRNRQTSPSSYKIKINKIKEKIKSKKEVSGIEIEHFLIGCPHFVGCYASDHTNDISIQSFPAFVIFNLDPSSKPGSHWIALRIDRSSVEIFDPLGFNLSNWPTIPLSLIDLLRRLGNHRKLLFSRQIQNSSSLLCGYFCIYYILMRQNYPLKKIEKQFSKRVYKNDSILLYRFSCNKF